MLDDFIPKTPREIGRLISHGSWEQLDVRRLTQPLIEATQSAISSFRGGACAYTGDEPIQVLDFFSGAGGTSLGFYSLNALFPAVKILGGCDINRISAETFSQNFSTPVLNCDIREIAKDSGALNELLKKVGYNKSKKTILIGCAPCQGFSSHRKKHWNEEDDVRNSLVLSFAKIVKKLKPDVIIMENVPEFLSKKYWAYYSAASKSFHECGYIIKSAIYNAAAFGVPQERFRTIVIGMKKKFLLPEPILMPHQYRTVKDAIGSLPPVKAGAVCPEDPLHKSVAHKPSTIAVIKSVPHNGGNRPVGVGPSCLDKVSGFSDVYGRLAWDKPSITITHFARNPASGRFSHPEQDRGLTARETALLQSFPTGFSFCGKSDDVYRQIGEAVPPLFASAVAASVLIEMLSCEPTNTQINNGVKPITAPVNSSYSSVIAGIKSKHKEIKFTCIDTFCGAGGLALGLQRAGFELLMSFDIDRKCIETLNANKKIYSHRKEVLDIKDALHGALLAMCSLRRGELFLLAGGPPCQGFSVQRRGSDKDERNALVLSYLKLIDEVYPCYFLMENVSGLGGKRGRTYLSQLVDGATSLGYKVHIRMLNACEYGVPQRRKRYIIVGERVDLGDNYEYPAPELSRVTVRDVIGNLPEPPYDGSEHPLIPLHRRDHLSRLNLERLKYLKQGESRDNLPLNLLANCHKLPSKLIGYGRVYGRMSWDDVAPTITARFDSFTRGQFGHPVQNRSITLREGAMLQTFPPDYRFVGSKVEIARQIGNAVPPKLGQIIGESIIQAYKKRRTHE